MTDYRPPKKDVRLRTMPWTIIIDHDMDGPSEKIRDPFSDPLGNELRTCRSGNARGRAYDPPPTKPQFTVSTVILPIPFSDAPIVEVPVPVVEIAPVALISATPISEEVHATCPVKGSVLPSLNVPVAVNC
jgi:hypothetical protein